MQACGAKYQLKVDTLDETDVDDVVFALVNYARNVSSWNYLLLALPMMSYVIAIVTYISGIEKVYPYYLKIFMKQNNFDALRDFESKTDVFFFFKFILFGMTKYCQCLRITWCFDVVFFVILKNLQGSIRVLSILGRMESNILTLDVS